MTEPVSLVVGEFAFDEELVILPREVLQYLVDVIAALNSATWGELRSRATPAVFEEIVSLAGYATLEEFLAKQDVGQPVPGAREAATAAYHEMLSHELPADDEPFEAQSIGACADGDFPPSHRLLQMAYVPDEVIEEFGGVYDTNFNGTFVKFALSDKEAIEEPLTSLGIPYEHDQALVGEAMSWY